MVTAAIRVVDMKHIERPGLYFIVILILYNVWGGNPEHTRIERELEATKTKLNYAIYLLEGGEPRNDDRTVLDCSRSTDKIIDCRPVE